MKKVSVFPILLTSLLLTSCQTQEIPPFETPDIVEAIYTIDDFTDHTVYLTSATPSVGEANLLVIPIWFTDSNDYINLSKQEAVRRDIETAFFGTDEQTGWKSVQSYYYQDSFGRSLLDGVVSPWYECGKPSTDFYNDGTYELLLDAVSWYKENHNNNNPLFDFDKDSDGYLDGVILVYGAPDYSALNNSNASNLWGYTTWLQTYPNHEDPVTNAFYWASYDFMYDPSTAKAVTGHAYGSGYCYNCNIDAHTFIHEMGHLYGLDDYYDYSYRGSPAAGFSMQDYNLGAHDPYSRFVLGWSEPYVPTKSCTFTVGNMEETGQFVLLSPEFTGSPFDEYILLEHYAPKGLNEFDSQYYYGQEVGPQEYGVRVWHVDSRLVKFVLNRTVLTTNAKSNYIYYATNNTLTRSAGGLNYAGSYYYNRLQLIRNLKDATYKNNYFLSDELMFHTGDSFSMSLYGSQFYNAGLLNSKTQLGWRVTFDEVNDEGMTITCYKG